MSASADHFAMLAQVRRPWLDAEQLKEVFHRRSAELHPDVPGTGDAAIFAELNAAYNVLREPASRLRHLLELTAPGLAEKSVPSVDFGDLFMCQAALHQRLAAFAARRATAGNPLARALLAGEVAALRREVEAMRSTVDAAQTSSLKDLRALDATWSATAPDDTRVRDLVRLQSQLTFLGRWTEQLREARFALEA